MLELRAVDVRAQALEFGAQKPDIRQLGVVVLGRVRLDSLNDGQPCERALEIQLAALILQLGTAGGLGCHAANERLGEVH